MATARRMRTETAAKRAVRSTEEQGKIRTHTTVKDRDGPYHDTQTEDTLLTRQFREGEHPAYVKVGAGMTIPLGQYESLRIDVSVSLPCLPSEIDDAYVTASDYVAEKLGEEETNWLGQSKPKSAKRG